MTFQSTPPVWGATSGFTVSFMRLGFQSTPPVWGATRPAPQAEDGPKISIHAPRVGGDLMVPSAAMARTFQSTPPVWGATLPAAGYPPPRSANFNPRPPCGGRLGHPGDPAGGQGISIHAPRVGGDVLCPLCLTGDEIISIHAPRVGGDRHAERPDDHLQHFNPRPPCGGRHMLIGSTGTVVFISIHAPRVGGDSCRSTPFSSVADFNPRPPCGGRQGPCSHRTRPGYFNPRPPCGGRPLRAGLQALANDISIHAPRVGGDPSQFSGSKRSKTKFQSTPPVWGATFGGVQRWHGLSIFQSTPPVWGATAKTAKNSICSREK